ncbi:MAG: methionyl-tRNA formyltransferase [Moraxella sp.]|nr:methionyl-tRNA formyltransferase [Moraxella sp.]
MTKKLRLIFAGTPDFAKVALQALIDHQGELSIDIVAVYTQPDRKAGRGQKLTASPVKELALAHHIPVEQPISFSLKSESGQVSRETLDNYRPDVMIVCAYGLILPLGVLNTPTYGCLNIHGSLLPRWRGAAPIHRAILAGDDETGITIMQMAQGLDTGDMLYKIACPINDTDTTQTLHDKLAELGGQAMITVLKDLAIYQANAKPQDDSLANYAEKITNNEGQIDWNNNAWQINRQIRALNAYVFLNGERIKLLECTPIKSDQTTTEMAGKVVSVGRKAILVACGADENGDQHLINITKMQWAGGKPLTAEQIAVGDKLKDGQVFD